MSDLQFRGPMREVLNQAIPEQLNTYLQTPYAPLLFPAGSDGLIFGGAIRDILAGQPIQDIDILCYNQSFAILSQNLVANGFTHVERDIPSLEIYNELKFLPALFQKGERKIELIKLRNPHFPPDSKPEDTTSRQVKEAMIRTASNVDIRACALGFSEKGGLLEFIPKAVEDSLLQRIIALPDNQMHHPDRCRQRIEKLKARGWYAVPDSSDQSPGFDPELGF